jgi:muramoyltetrapeptide carboxypeptidase LdcA involved in peptidoglycan recycling
MDTPYAQPEGLRHWTEVAAADGGTLAQHAPGRHRGSGHDSWEDDPGVTTMTLDTAGSWSVLDTQAVDVTGRLVGGCLEVLSPLAGTPFGDVAAFGREHADDGLLVVLEVAGAPAHDVARMLHGLRLAGWFDDADAVLVGRTSAPGEPGMSQREAVADALGSLEVPVVLDVDCGHVQPMMPLVLGAPARVVVDHREQSITQDLTRETGR